MNRVVEHSAVGRQRIAAYDVMRILACVLVCLSHVSVFTVPRYEQPIFYFIVQYITEIDVPLFFMISGALLLPVKVSSRDFLKKRVKTIGIPFLVWTVPYFIYGIRTYPPIWKLWLISIPFEPVVNCAFWFLYVLFGLYLISPILSHWLKACSKRELKVYLGIWFFTSFFVYFSNFPDFPNINYRSPLYYLFGYVGYYVLGFYLKKHINYDSKYFYRKLLLLFLIGAVLPPIIEAYSGIGFIGEWDLGPICVCLGVSVFLFVFKLTRKRASAPILSGIASLSFGVYLINTFMIDFLYRFLYSNELPAWLMFIIDSSLCITVSFLIIQIIGLIPGGRYIIGPTRQWFSFGHRYKNETEI